MNTTAEMEQIKRVLESNLEKLNCPQSLREFLEARGFVTQRKLNSSCGKIYVNHDLKVVVKHPFISGGVKPPQYAIETIQIRLVHGFQIGGFDYQWLYIQPLADASRRACAKAYQYFRELWNKGERRSSDFHADNTALHEGEPVIIDW
jgi:hypothetical protein